MIHNIPQQATETRVSFGVVTSFTCPEETLKALDDLAHEENISRSALIRWVLSTFVEELAKQK